MVPRMAKGKKGISRKEKRRQEREEKKKIKQQQKTKPNQEKKKTADSVSVGEVVGKSNLKKGSDKKKSKKKTVKFDLPETSKNDDDGDDYGVFEDEEFEGFDSDDDMEGFDEAGLSDDDLDEDDFDDYEEEEDDGDNAEDTWAALEALKKKKQKLKEPATSEERMAALKALKEKKQGTKEPETAEDTMAALKAMKEKKQKARESESAEDTMKSMKEKKDKTKKRKGSDVDDGDSKKNKKAKKEIERTPISSYEKQMMAQDEMEMEYYSKKLGLKSMKLDAGDDGLDDLLGDLDFENFAEGSETDDDGLGGGKEDDFEREESDESEDEEEDDDDNEEADEKPVKVKENPYVAPGTTPGKYVPPSKRRLPEDASGESEETIRLRKQVKGLLNRVSESNIGSILAEIDSLYLSHSRIVINSVITDVILESISLQGRLNEQFLIVHAAFVAAMYRTVGVEFGAHFVQTLVETFDKHYNNDAKGKESVNLLALLSQIYSFHVVSCNLIYDFIRMLLDGVNEPKTELLLKLIDSSGSQLRSDDPAALKDIIYLLHAEVGKADPSTINTRTKFLIERITDLKNNRQKKHGSQIALETTQRMKKFLGGVSGRGGEPLRVTLDDIRNIDKKGKWWLVGAAWRNQDGFIKPTSADVDVEAMQDILDTAEPNWMELAKQQRMNTDIRRAIFVALMSSEDYVDACDRMQKLKLKSKQEREIPRVILHCCSNEEAYNPFYALVATKLCAQHSLKKTFQFALWDYIGVLQGEDDDPDAIDDGIDKLKSRAQKDSTVELKKTMHYSKLYAQLVADGAMTLDILKTMDFLTAVTEVRIFLELFYITLFQNLGKRAEAGDQRTKKVGFGDAMFETRRDESVLTQILARTKEQNVLRGTQYFQRFVTSSTTMPKKQKQRERVEWASNLTLKIIDRYLEREL
ncbi:hypothetical protein TRICI_006220 [Trichomonascus ciferrii]|uniref:MI domain-containing protein n=1 Tax=Trichomonascus ciferrii TaxID=44093 RepID=A0A642UJW8_9ASCO|nr:hypothetical protein TRICI_006220 [Trichomonascus ciferrii]